MKSRLIFVCCVFALVALLLVVGCAKPALTPTPTPTGPIKIGAILDLTGPGANFGPVVKQGIEFAINEAGGTVAGRKIQLIVEDSGTDPTIAVDKARKLLEQDKVCAIMGPIWSNETVALYSFVQPYGIPYIHHTSVCAPRLQDPATYYNVFAIGATEWASGYSIADYAYDEMGARTATVIVADYAGGWTPTEAFAQRFEEKGGKIVQIQPVIPGTTEWSATILNLQKADMLWFGSNAPQVFFHQYKSLGGNLPICLIGYDWMTWAEKQDASDDALGVITTGVYSSLLNTPETKAFAAKYSQATGDIADCYDEGGYTVAKIILGAIEYTKGDTSSKALNDALQKITFDTPRGKVSFNPGGWLECPQYIFKYVRADGFINLEPLSQHPIYQPLTVTWSYSEWSAPK